MPDIACFSFSDMNHADATVITGPMCLTASDGVNLAYYHAKAEKPAAALLFIHGGGAYGLAGYQRMAKELSTACRISVYLPDIRGHGNSGGPRGGTPRVEQVFDDIKTMVDFIKSENPGIPYFLGGHSSGGGLILNYMTHTKNSDAAGCIYISPQFGFRSNTARKKVNHPFARVNLLPFIFNGISGGKLFGNTHAVFFNYPESVIKKNPLFIRSITCNMANAITPGNPLKQFAGMDKPFGLFIGENDELFDPEKIIQYAGLAKEEIRSRSVYRIVKNENHLSILKNADKLISEAILKISPRG